LAPMRDMARRAAVFPEGSRTIADPPASPSHSEELSIRRLASQSIVFALADPGNHIPAPIRPLHSPVVNHMQHLGPEPQLDLER
jgi:hypothetical protein